MNVQEAENKRLKAHLCQLQRKLWSRDAADERSKAVGTEARVCEDIRKRQLIGMAKYGCTVESNPLPDVEWLEHAYQEGLDKCIYLKRAIDSMRAKEST